MATFQKSSIASNLLIVLAIMMILLLSGSFSIALGARIYSIDVSAPMRIFSLTIVSLTLVLGINWLRRVRKKNLKSRNRTISEGGGIFGCGANIKKRASPCYVVLYLMQQALLPIPADLSLYLLPIL